MGLSPVPVVHIGYHKTATCWLKKFFSELEGDRATVFMAKALWRQLIAPTALAFKERRCRRYVDFLVRGQGGRVCVFSIERLSGSPHSGGHDAPELAERIKAAFGDARILLVVREQVSMLVSIYKQYVRDDGICTLEEYLVPPRDGRVPLFRLGYFRYHLLAQHYRRLFGEGRVLILPYELLLQDRNDFVRRVLEHSGLDGSTTPEEDLEQWIHVSPSDLHIRLRRWVNLMSGGTSVHPVRPKAPRLAALLQRLLSAADATDAARTRSGRLRERAARVAGDRYVSSNRILQRYVACDLRSLGYRM